MIIKNKRGKFAPLWIFVGVFFFIFIIALIEPMKPFLEVAIDGLSCDTSDNGFILGTCFLLKGGIVLFMGTVIFFIWRWVYFKSREK